ncbi:MAG: hypothetical protein ABJR05_06050 [Balneola sp.]
MKKLLLLFSVIFTTVFITNTANAQDGFFSNAKTLEKGTGSIGLQPVFLTNQDCRCYVIR